MNQQLISGISSNGLKKLLEDFDAKSVFLVTGKNSYLSSGSKELIEAGLEGIEHLRFSDFEKNPKFEDAMKGKDLALKKPYDLFIGIGGGSVLDMTKLINIFSANEEINSLDIVEDSSIIEKQGKPTILIPTTAGSGSEATHFAVIYHDNKKYSVSHPFLLADIVGLNHELTWTQSQYLTACAGLDALSQAIESYWSVGSTSESKELAGRAIKLSKKHLISAVNNPNPENREAIQLAAYLAGRAINISKTTAPHAFSYAFTTFHSVPHGHAVFLTLPYFFLLNNPTGSNEINDPRGLSYIEQTLNDLCSLLGVDSPENACKFLYDFAEKIGVSLEIKKLGIDTESELDFILSQVNLERLGNNPSKVEVTELKTMLLSG